MLVLLSADFGPVAFERSTLYGGNYSSKCRCFMNFLLLGSTLALLHFREYNRENFYTRRVFFFFGCQHKCSRKSKNNCQHIISKHPEAFPVWFQGGAADSLLYPDSFHRDELLVASDCTWKTIRMERLVLAQLSHLHLYLWLLADTLRFIGAVES